MRRSPGPTFTREGRLLRAVAPRTKKPRSQRMRERKALHRQETSALNCYPWHPPSACRFLFAANGRPPGLPRRLADQIKHSFSKICGDQIVRAPPSTDVNLCSRGAYQIAVAIERIQQTRLVGAGVRLNSSQCALVDEECRFQRTVVPPEPHGSPGLVI